MIALTLIPMLAALGLQAADAVPAEEPELVERNAMWFPPEAAKNDVVARCIVTLDIRPDGTTHNRCGTCKTATPHDFIKAERYEKVYLRVVLRVLREWRYKPSETGFKAHTQNFDFNLAHLNPDLLASIETPAAPVCD